MGSAVPPASSQKGEENPTSEAKKCLGELEKTKIQSPAVLGSAKVRSHHGGENRQGRASLSNSQGLEEKLFHYITNSLACIGDGIGND